MRENARTIFELLPKNAQGAEFGAHDGHWTRGLVEVAAPTELTLVDPWAEDAERDRRALAFAAEQATHDAALAAMQSEFPQARFVRKTSTEALAAMSDRSLDWAFLDGQKHYDVVLADLEEAVRVVRPGGVIAGGGYRWAPELGRPVAVALQDLTERLPGSDLTRAGQFWALRLPDRPKLAPRPEEPRFLVVSTMKNEAPYIVEWVAHHLAIGFTDFLVFTNDCDDGTDELLQALGQVAPVTHAHNNVLRRGPHKSALKWARDHALRLKSEWVLIADVDEFINVRSGDGTVQGLLRDLGPETDVVSFPWKVFGQGGVEAFEDRPITAQFTTCEPVPRRGGRRMRDVKTLFRKPEAMFHLGLHRPRVKDEWQQRIVWKSPSGEDISDRMNKGKTWTMRWDGCGDAAYMHHYPLRSLEAYILKKNRGRANHINEDLGREYWDKWNMSGGRDDSLVQGAPGFAEVHARLMSDRGVRRAHRTGVAWHRDQFARLMEEERYRSLWEELRGRGAA
ncbi:glycosyltransferase family 2 protein [Jannaschia aquimarina]|uniref:Glycosyl transferase family 2 n=1 Tax=Jannaschia aquimarina TaxID=935700 RepID=A0A0D1ECU8_9RHOB|nr:glycosyltransferase family 2 protein [Jannaschia aquimarina]KIT15554.1 hypothetical protein jaqu_26500 [Jannaschia aquimarina]SNT26863.1 Methyltransferase domain-containing protein [Jannaschia aquimarina]